MRFEAHNNPFSFKTKGPPIDEITNELKLRFYGLFKQVSTGPCNESAPSRLKVVQRMKWYDKFFDISNAFIVLANTHMKQGGLEQVGKDVKGRGSQGIHQAAHRIVCKVGGLEGWKGQTLIWHSVLHTELFYK